MKKITGTINFGTKPILLNIKDAELAEFVQREYLINERAISVKKYKTQVCVVSGVQETEYLILEGGKPIRKIKVDVNTPVNIKEFILQGLVELCLHKNGFYFMHASSYMVGNNLFVFLGPSGSGKTTIVQLLKPKNITSNDTMVLRKNSKNTISLYTSPFDANSFVKKSPIDIKSVQFYKLTKSKINIILKLKLHEKIELLIQNMNLFMFAMQTNVVSMPRLKSVCQKQAAKAALALQNSSEIHNLNFNLNITKTIFLNILKHE